MTIPGKLQEGGVWCAREGERDRKRGREPERQREGETEREKGEGGGGEGRGEGGGGGKNRQKKILILHSSSPYQILENQNEQKLVPSFRIIKAKQEGKCVEHRDSDQASSNVRFNQGC